MGRHASPGLGAIRRRPPQAVARGSEGRGRCPCTSLRGREQPQRSQMLVGSHGDPTGGTIETGFGRSRGRSTRSWARRGGAVPTPQSPRHRRLVGGKLGRSAPDSGPATCAPVRGSRGDPRQVPPGQRLACRSWTGLTLSSTKAARRIVDSACQLPTSCTLIGRPSRLVPNRIDRPGRPVMFSGTVAPCR